MVYGTEARSVKISLVPKLRIGTRAILHTLRATPVQYSVPYCRARNASTGRNMLPYDTSIGRTCAKYRENWTVPYSVLADPIRTVSCTDSIEVRHDTAVPLVRLLTFNRNVLHFSRILLPSFALHLRFVAFFTSSAAGVSHRPTGRERQTFEGKRLRIPRIMRINKGQRG